MPLTVNVGLSKELDPPNGSLGVACNIEVEIDVASLDDVHEFDQTIKEAYSVCEDAIDNELQRQGIAVNVRGMPISCNRFACARRTSQRAFATQKRPEEPPS